MSMPIAPTYVSHICEIDKALQQLTRAPEDTVEALRNPLSGTKAVHHSIRANHSDISATCFERFKSILLRTQATPECRKAIQKLLDQPMQVSNDELRMILQLRDHKQNRKAPKEDSVHVFYVRSWTFMSSKLLRLVKLLRKRGFTSPRLEEWEFQSCIALCGTLTVRYVGMAGGGRTATQRHKRDQNDKSRNTLHGEFMHIVDEECPDPCEFQLHEFPEMGINVIGNDKSGVLQLADDMERLLIQLFGYRSLLNVQIGGRNINYLPQAIDSSIFEGLGSDYFKKLPNKCSLLPDSKWNQTASFFMDIKKHSKSYKNKNIIHKNSFKVMETQARPYEYCGNVILAFLGEEPSDNHLTAGNTFFKGNCGASLLVKSLVNHIANMNEYETSSKSHWDLSKSFTFINSLPLPDYSDLTGGLQGLRNYFISTRPIVVVSLGKRSSFTLESNLKKLYFKKPSQPLGKEGWIKVIIRQYGETWDDSYTHIALRHPGSYLYATRDHDHLRSYYLQFQLVYFIAFTATEVLDELESRSMRLSRRDVCLKILNRVRDFLHNREGVILKSAGSSGEISFLKTYSTLNVPTTDLNCRRIFQDIKKVLKQRIDALNTRMESENSDSTLQVGSNRKRKAKSVEKDKSSPVFGRGTFHNIFSLGRAVGTPNSQERFEHLKALWAKNVPELHIMIPHREEKYPQWNGEFSTLHEGQFYFLKVLSQMSQPLYITTLAKVCNSAIVGRRRFDEISGSTELKCGLWVSRDRIKAYRTENSPFILTNEMQGHPIEVKLEGHSSIKWKTTAGSSITWKSFAQTQSGSNHPPVEFET
ncbi:uncharacterized protein TRUGW13939_04365 [Talaromyces rugulosus]|uniref:Uncharacterized protein n=1 Tax=Talaromyces rugulosus TaxID=121627 RepID=A0A7H8QTG2_TALRU|nr:uncharacterized protein TRUGW13939_04365 [Talaromyces rugulosus]QKX57257.1 hypothetical protein TRUGW13939_04365 [Talaromyces rugulosus]